MYTRGMCKVIECETRETEKHCKGYCMRHYRRFKATGDPLKSLWDLRKELKPTECEIENCTAKIFAINLCANHYRRHTTYGNPTATDLRTRPHGTKKCTIKNCEKRHNAKGYCSMHYARWKNYGDPNFTKHSETRLDNNGYVWKGSSFEHRVVMEKILRRKLVPGENVHHKNGNKKDNRPENLELWSRSQPYGQRVSDKIDYAIEILSLYAPDRLKENNE